MAESKNMITQDPQNTVTPEELLAVIGEQTITIRRLSEALNTTNKRIRELTPVAKTDKKP